MSNNRYYTYLSHGGKKGMKWGYNDGKRNGKRVAGDEDENSAGVKNLKRDVQTTSKNKNVSNVMNKIRSNVQSSVKGAADKIKDWAGVDEREAYNKAKETSDKAKLKRDVLESQYKSNKENYYKTMKDGGNTRAAANVRNKSYDRLLEADSEYKDANKETRAAQNAYEKTLVSKVDKVAAAGKKVVDGVKKSLDKAVDSVSDKVAKAGADIVSKILLGYTSKDLEKLQKLGDTQMKEMENLYKYGNKRGK